MISAGSEGASDPLARQFVAKREYEHNMERTAYNFCYGPFGGISQKDYICVQSMDGQLQFFEQDKLVFCRFLHNFVVPGVLPPPTQCQQDQPPHPMWSFARDGEKVPRVQKYQKQSGATGLPTPPTHPYLSCGPGPRQYVQWVWVLRRILGHNMH